MNTATPRTNATNEKTPTTAELLALIEALRTANAELQEKANRKVSFKVTEKGGVSLYGLGRFPITLYKSQWEAVIANVEGLKKFMTDNSASLKVKE